MTTTPDAAKVAEIAAGLSKAQRRILISARDTLFGSDVVLFLRDRHSTRVIINLRRKHICEPDMMNRDRLTNFGLEVREYLKENERAQ